MTAVRTASLADRFARSYVRAFEPEAVATRQLPFGVAYLVSFTLTLTVVDPDRPMMWFGLLVVVTVQFAAFVVPWERLNPHWQSVLPLAQMGSLVLLEVGSGAVFTYPTALIFLPVVGLSMQPGFLGVVLASVGAFLTVETIALTSGSDRWDALVTRTAVVPLTALLVGLGVHGVMNQLRTRTQSLLALQQEQARALTEVRESNEALTLMTERLRSTSESLYGVINAASLHAIIGVDNDGRITLFSKGAEELLGYPGAAALGMSMASVYDETQLRSAMAERGLPWDSEGRRQLTIGAASHGGTSVGEWLWRRRDGEAIPVQVVATARPPLPDGTSSGYLFVATDVTQQHEAARLQDEFIGLVSHELRTPLTGILGYLELLRMSPDPLTDDQRADLDVIERNARRLLRLVNDLLLSVQLSAGTFNLVAESTDLADVARQSALTLAPAAEAGGVELVVDAPDPVPLYADPVRLTQVVENLLSNAVKFTPEGGTVTVRTRPGPAEEGSHVGIVEVSDTGIGIGPAEIGKLTERFFRTKSAHDRRIRGIGLGLPIAQAIVEAHKGRVDVKSVLGSGTTFTVTIPDLPAPTDA